MSSGVRLGVCTYLWLLAYVCLSALVFIRKTLCKIYLL
jgi:hypothetical protein